MDVYKQKQEAVSLTQAIFTKVRNDILNNQYRAGEKLKESEISKELCVSRTPVREALQQLAMKGYVSRIPNRGIEVNEITEQDMRDVINLLVVIEPIAIQWAVERISEEDIEELDELCNLMEFFCFKGNTEKVFELDTKFHEIIYKSIHNRYFEHTLMHFHLLLKTQRKSMIEREWHVNEILYEHRLILGAFIEKDIENAIQHSVNHNKALQEILIKNSNDGRIRC